MANELQQNNEKVNEFYLPQDLIHHIQSFLNAREHAQSSVLAKSWYFSCPIRPVQAFAEEDIKYSHPGEDALLHLFFTSSVETLNRYKTLNLKLDKFMLKLKRRQVGDVSHRVKLAGELITSSLELGVSDIELKLNYAGYSKYRLKYDFRYDLPAQVFASSSLIRLSIDGYIIDGVNGDRGRCSRLKSLVLDNVKTTDDIVRDIIVSCPLIENLDLCHCKGLEKLNVSKLTNLVGFRVDEVEGLPLMVQFMDLDGMNVAKFRCLRRLQLEKVRIGAEFFTMFDYMFPYVEDLTLGYCGEYEEIKFSSNSLRRLELGLSLHEWERLTKVQLNIPNISKFEFKAGWGDISIKRKFKPLPSISFDNVSKDWESDVQLLWRCNLVEACWFEDLRKFLIQLNLSRISLHVIFIGDIIVLGEEIPGFLAIPVVEKLQTKHLEMEQLVCNAADIFEKHHESSPVS